MEYFFRFAEELSNDDEVLVEKDFELYPEKFVKISDIMMTGNNH